MENFPKTNNKHESREGEPIAELEASVNQLDTHATRLEREGSGVDISEETAERVDKKAGKIKNFLKVASMGIALYGTYEVGSYVNSRHEITTEVGQDGKIKYDHEDPETTRILKFLTGAEGLALEDRIHFYREAVRNAHVKLAELTNPAELEIDAQNTFEGSLPTDEQGLRERLRDIYTKYDMAGFGSVQSDIEKRIDETFDKSIASSVEYNPAMEKMVWNLQMKVGSPRIRWAAPKENLWSQVQGSFAGPGRANYSLEDNTIYITPGTGNEALGGMLVAEDAHALQFNERPISSRVRYVVDTAQTLVRSIRESRTMHEAQHDQYDTPGSIEYEAHKVIEPRLISEALEEENKFLKNN
jgi:hypothetical protein